MGVAAGAVHEAGAGKGQHFSICGPVSAQLFGCIEQLRRTGAAGQRLAAAVEQQRRGGAGGEADPADVHTGIGQSVRDAVSESILAKLR